MRVLRFAGAVLPKCGLLPAALDEAALGEAHGLVQTTDGAVWGAGFGTYMGRDRAELCAWAPVLAQARLVACSSAAALVAAGDELVSLDRGEHVSLDGVPRRIACTADAAVVVLEDGQTLFFELCPLALSRRLGAPRRVGSVACGAAHTALLDNAGVVWTFGRGLHGQLGHGDQRDRADPEPVEALQGLPVTQIAAHARRTLSLSELGDVYSTGAGPFGELLLGPETLGVSVPELVDLDGPVGQVACGQRHTVVRKQDGAVLGAGCSRFGQLLETRSDSIFDPVRIAAPCDGVERVVCGAWTTLLLGRGVDADGASCI